jgi:hypothetical protein
MWKFQSVWQKQNLTKANSATSSGKCWRNSFWKPDCWQLRCHGPENEIFAAVCLHLLSMGGSLPYSDWENLGTGQGPVKVNHPSVRNTCIYWIRQWASFHGWGGTVGGWGFRNNLKATHSLLPPEFRKSRIHKQDSKIVIGKTMPGDPSSMGSVTEHSLAQDEV